MGVIKESGKKFWSTKDSGQQPFTYQAGVGGVIKGWDQGCLGMKVGEKREVYIHPDLGYGSNSCLAPNALLTFEVELTGMKETAAKTSPSEMSDLPGMDTFALDEVPHHDTVK